MSFRLAIIGTSNVIDSLEKQSSVDDLGITVDSKRQQVNSVEMEFSLLEFVQITTIIKNVGGLSKWIHEKFFHSDSKSTGEVLKIITPHKTIEFHFSEKREIKEITEIINEALKIPTKS